MAMIDMCFPYPITFYFFCYGSNLARSAIRTWDLVLVLRRNIRSLVTLATSSSKRPRLLLGAEVEVGGRMEGASPVAGGFVSSRGRSCHPGSFAVAQIALDLKGSLKPPSPSSRQSGQIHSPSGSSRIIGLRHSKWYDSSHYRERRSDHIKDTGRVLTLSHETIPASSRSSKHATHPEADSTSSGYSGKSSMASSGRIMNSVKNAPAPMLGISASDLLFNDTVPRKDLLDDSVTTHTLELDWFGGTQILAAESQFCGLSAPLTVAVPVSLKVVSGLTTIQLFTVSAKCEGASKRTYDTLAKPDRLGLTGQFSVLFGSHNKVSTAAEPCKCRSNTSHCLFSSNSLKRSSNRHEETYSPGSACGGVSCVSTRMFKLSRLT